MKNHFFPFLVLLLFCFSQTLLGQEKLRVVKATSDKTYFIEDKSSIKSDWWLDPSLKLDIYQTRKIFKAKWIAFHTDIESFRVKLKPGESYDFIVLLNGKDTCRTRIEATPPLLKYAQITPATHDTIPFILTEQNNIKIQVRLNEKDTLDLHFDTGGTGIVLTHDAIKNKTNLLADKGESFKTRDYAPFNDANTLQIGNLKWQGLPIYPVSLTPKGTDGHFGWDLFDGRMVELDYEKEIMIVHSSLPNKPKGYSKLKMEHINTLFCVKGKLKVKGKKYENLFLFDTGYQRTILLDSILMKEQSFPKDLPVIKTTTLRNGQGKVFHTKIINSEQMIFGKSIASNIPTQLLNTANPAHFKVHILGNELLKRFNTILDFQQDCVYLKTNDLMKLSYIDAS